jgi:hypothetical protein
MLIGQRFQAPSFDDARRLTAESYRQEVRR